MGIIIRASDRFRERSEKRLIYKIVDLVGDSEHLDCVKVIIKKPDDKTTFTSWISIDDSIGLNEGDTILISRGKRKEHKGREVLDFEVLCGEILNSENRLRFVKKSIGHGNDPGHPFAGLILTNKGPLRS